MKMTLLAIFAALAFMIGSFIWFVATWDAEAEEPVSNFFWPILPPEASDITTLITARSIAPMNGTVGGAHLAQPNSGARPSFEGAKA